MATTDVLWAAWDGRGLEHVRLSVAPDAVRADSLLVSMDEEHPFRARYLVECDPAWRVRQARIDMLEEPPRVMDLRVDASGRWTDAGAGVTLPLDGCVDVDIYPSPFTNTLPMRRLARTPVGRPIVIAVAWVVLPALTIQTAPQEYTLLERSEAGARWRFRALDSDFTAELEVDRQGVVRDYPELARRIL